ncbi:peptidoglycan bridge formation glycyltransferase FemA/FemB family protein [Sphingobacterium olei]|uniref:Peptidoglycan bridge formation glycyltransferase FemA/FemB family protein n=1 Tax=Sphingobacterium olei TaxID=2571155 RepID=A0A4U0P6P2_9SPHI|nr:peptidoglycan bridge formation glycyltransferase FemA/FemB family protein [Sphingobacterium olei]TJZ62960.1 peptidoglycan bridge formation glycyltransferase FemA/FemB family protein [Sphingobacterium olei]
MITDIDEKNIKQVYKTSIIQQTAYWSEVKKLQGLTSKAFNFKTRQRDLFVDCMDNSYFIGDLLVIIQSIDKNHCIAYVPYGPEVEPSEECQGFFLEQLSEGLRDFLPNNCIMIRYDLSWESLWAKSEIFYAPDGTWLGAPDYGIQEMRLNINTENWRLKKANTNILPSNTIFLDLKRNDDWLLSTMKPKTRYNIRLSSKKGVEVHLLGLESLGIWYKLYSETAIRNNFVLHDISYFEAILSTKANDTLSPADVYLLIAQIDNKPLAAMFLVISAQRATYLYGASSSENRNYMATYSLQWQAMLLAKEKGCTEYDFFGVSPQADPAHPMYGLHRFKTGFGGTIYHRMGCWDYPLDEIKYKYYASTEFRNQSYHLV